MTEHIDIKTGDRVTYDFLQKAADEYHAANRKALENGVENLPQHFYGLHLNDYVTMLAQMSIAVDVRRIADTLERSRLHAVDQFYAERELTEMAADRDEWKAALKESEEEFTDI